MKKTFPLTDPKHAPPRVLDRIKNEIRKYLKRERRKALPEDADEWDFDCRIGAEGEDAAQVVPVKDVIAAIDKVGSDGSATVYVEILAKPVRRPGVQKDGPPGSAD